MVDEVPTRPPRINLMDYTTTFEQHVDLSRRTDKERQKMEGVLAEYRQLVCDFVHKTSRTEAAKEFAENVTRLSEALIIALNSTLFGWRLRRKQRFSQISKLWNSNVISISQRMPAWWQSTTVLTWG